MSETFPGQTSVTESTNGVYRVQLTKVTSFLIMTQRRSVTYTGTLEQLDSIARGARMHTLLLGWWGVPAGPVWTTMALARNAKAMRQVHELARKG